MSASSAERAALLRKFAKGQTLSPEDRAEIAVIIPATTAVLKRVTSENYRRTYAQYAADFVGYGMEDTKDKARKLKHWIAKGRYDKNGQLRDEPDFPPFDEPAQLAAWWRRNSAYPGSVPDWMVVLEKSDALGETKEQPEAKPSASASEPAAAAKTSTPSHQPDLTVTYGDLQIDATLANDLTVKLLAGAVMDSLRRYNDARANNNSKAAAAIRDDLLKEARDLQKAKLEAQKLQAQAGDYFRRKETMLVLNGLLAMLDTSFANALEEVIRIACPQMEPDARRALARQQRDKVFEHFHRTEFREVWQPADEP